MKKFENNKSEVKKWINHFQGLCKTYDIRDDNFSLYAFPSGIVKKEGCLLLEFKVFKKEKNKKIEIGHVYIQDVEHFKTEKVEPIKNLFAENEYMERVAKYISYDRIKNFAHSDVYDFFMIDYPQIYFQKGFGHLYFYETEDVEKEKIQIEEDIKSFMRIDTKGLNAKNGIYNGPHFSVALTNKTTGSFTFDDIYRINTNTSVEHKRKMNISAAIHHKKTKNTVEEDRFRDFEKHVGFEINSYNIKIYNLMFGNNNLFLKQAFETYGPFISRAFLDLVARNDFVGGTKKIITVLDEIKSGKSVLGTLSSVFELDKYIINAICKTHPHYIVDKEEPLETLNSAIKGLKAHSTNLLDLARQQSFDFVKILQFMNGNPKWNSKIKYDVNFYNFLHWLHVHKINYFDNNNPTCLIEKESLKSDNANKYCDLFSKKKYLSAYLYLKYKQGRLVDYTGNFEMNLDEIGDMLDAFVGDIIIKGKMRDYALTIIDYCFHSLNHMKNISQDWHDNILDYNMLKKQQKVTQWFVPMEKTIIKYRTKEYLCKPIKNSMDLYLEGDEMSHCVGGRKSRCENGESFIFSVSNKSERATVEIVFDRYSNPIIYEQKMSHNRRLTDNLAEVTKILLDEFKCNFKKNYVDRKISFQPCPQEISLNDEQTLYTFWMNRLPDLEPLLEKLTRPEKEAKQKM